MSAYNKFVNYRLIKIQLGWTARSAFRARGQFQRRYAEGEIAS